MTTVTTTMNYKVKPYPARPKTPWQLELYKNRKERIRKLFRTEIEANAEGERLLKLISQGGFEALEKEKVAVMPLATAIKRFRAVRKDKGRHAYHLGRVMDDFESKLGKMELAEISPSVLSAYWERPEWEDGKSTRRLYFSYIRIFFNWCERYDLIEKNPIKRVDAPKIPKPLKNILSPVEMLALLNRAVELSFKDVQAQLAICGFAGLRSSEFLALEKGDVDLKHGEIHVQGGKTGERFVEILPALLRWLPKGWTHRTDMNIIKHKRAVAENAWKQNCLRHSFATYHLAWKRNAGETAHQMGHSDSRMVSRVYALAARRAAGDEWWAL